MPLWTGSGRAIQEASFFLPSLNACLRVGYACLVYHVPLSGQYGCRAKVCSVQSEQKTELSSHTFPVLPFPSYLFTGKIRKIWKL